MATIKCHVCGHRFDYHGADDLTECPKRPCFAMVETGLEKSLRKRFEEYRNELPLPKMTAGRAIGFASAIYEFSTHNERIDVGHIEDRLSKHLGTATGFEKSSIRDLSTRSREGVTDQRTGLAIYVVSGKHGMRTWNNAFIVFRGSRGSAAGSKANPQEAGWGRGEDGELHNIDWATNFSNDQATPSWCTGVKVHRGFLELYSSMRDTVHNQVNQISATYGPNVQFIVTGHSLGAALTQLCTHDLTHSTAIKPFCFAFCPPKVGNLAFARDYFVKISSMRGELPSESGGGWFPRSFLFVQSTDPVSWGSKHGFQHVNATSIRSKSDSANTLKQGIYSLGKTASRTNIFYLVPNVYKVSFWGVHSYKKMEKELLGSSKR